MSLNRYRSSYSNLTLIPQYWFKYQVSNTLRLVLSLEYLFKNEAANEASIPDKEYKITFEGVIYNSFPQYHSSYHIGYVSF